MLWTICNMFKIMFTLFCTLMFTSFLHSKNHPKITTDLQKRCGINQIYFCCLKHIWRFSINFFLYNFCNLRGMFCFLKFFNFSNLLIWILNCIKGTLKLSLGFLVLYLTLLLVLFLFYLIGGTLLCSLLLLTNSCYWH